MKHLRQPARITRALKYGLIIMLGAWLNPVAALPDDKLKAMHLNADSVEIDDAIGITIYAGNVVFTQGTLKLKAETLTVERQATGEQITATGKPVYFEQLPKLGGELVHGTSLTMEYRSEVGILLLNDSAEVHQGRNSFTNDRIRFDTNRSTVKAGQITEGQERVQSIILPRSTDTDVTP